MASRRCDGSERVEVRQVHLSRAGMSVAEVGGDGLEFSPWRAVERNWGGKSVRDMANLCYGPSVQSVVACLAHGLARPQQMLHWSHDK